jgi:hypothetical protein
LRRAAEVAAQAGDPEKAGHAALVMLEELSSYLSNNDLRDAVERAEILVEKTQDISILRRLARCVCRGFIFIYDHPELPHKVDWSSFNVGTHEWQAFASGSRGL